MCVEKVTVQIDGLSLPIAVTYRKGSKDLILFIHGLGCSKKSFSFLWDAPDLKSYSLLVFDLPGFGASPGTMKFSYTMEDHARVCVAVLKRFAFDRLHVVAHSMGGAVGLLLEEEVDLPFTTFVNVEGNLVSEDCGLVSRETIRVPYEEFEKTLFPEYKERYGKDEGRYLALKASDPLAFYKSSESLVQWSDSGRLLDRFKSIPCRKSYFYGERNASLPVLDHLDRVETRMIPSSGHFSMIDNPEAFSNKLVEVIEDSGS